MLRATLLGTAVLLTLSGCAQISDSRFNPLNWFGSSTEVAAVDQNGVQRPLIPARQRQIVFDNRALVQSITSMNVDRSPTGAIVRAVGVAQTQGYFNAELINRGVQNGVLILEFRAQAPMGLEVPGTSRSRQISAAYVVEGGDLASIQSVRVQSATNARTSRR